MTPTPHEQVPEALLHASYLDSIFVSEEVPASRAGRIAKELRRLHVENEALRAKQSNKSFAQLYPPNPDAKCKCEHWQYCAECHPTAPQQGAAYVEKPAEIEHVAGDVSKNGAELNMSTAQPVAQQGAADGFFLLLPQRPKPEAPAGTAGLDWDAYSGAQMLAFGRDCSDAAIAALRTQQPAPATQQAGWTDADADAARLALELECLLMDTKDAAVVSKWWASANDALEMHRARLQEVQPSPTPQADSVLEDAARWKMAVLVGNEVMLHPEKRTHPAAIKAYMDAVHSGLNLTGAIDAASKQGENHD